MADTESGTKETDTMRVTQKDIARALNVSVMAVQRALNNSGYVSKELKQRILSYAEQRHYQPHRVAQALVRKKVRRLALFSVDTPDFFWNEVQVGVETAQDQIAPFGYEVTYQRVHPSDTEVYLRRVEESCAAGLDAVALVNNYEFHMERIYALLERRGVPYITFNVDAENTKRLCFIGPDYTLEGRLAADFTGKSLRGRGSVLVIFSSIHTDWNAYPNEISSQRLEGFTSFMEKEYPRVKTRVVALDYPSTEREIQRKISNLLTASETKFDAVYCIPHYSAIVGSCVRDAGLAGKTTLVTFDLSAELKELIRTNVVTASVCQKPVIQGYYAVRVLEHILETKSPPRESQLFISPHLVMKSNVDVEDDIFTIRSANMTQF